MKSKLYVQFSDDGRHIRRWSAEPFEGAVIYKLEHVPVEVWTKIPSVGQ